MPEEEITQNSSADDAAQDDEKESDEESAEYENLEQNQQEGQSSGFGLTGPEAIMMIFLGACFDVLGWFCLALDVLFGMGEIFSPFVSISATFLIGGWMYIRTGNMPSKKKGQDFSKRIQEKLIKRLGTSTLVSIVPFLGKIFPVWTSTVIMELRSS